MLDLLIVLAGLGYSSATAAAHDTLVLRTAVAAPTFDGRVSEAEYGSPTLLIPTPAGDVQVWLLRHEEYVYLAAKLPDSTYYWGDDLVVSLDPDGNGGDHPSLDDRQWYLRRAADSSVVAVITSASGRWADPGVAPVTLGSQRGGDDWDVATHSTQYAWSIELRIRRSSFSTGGKHPRIALRTFNDDPQGWWSWPAAPEGMPAHRVEITPDLWTVIALR